MLTDAVIATQVNDGLKHCITNCAKSASEASNPQLRAALAQISQDGIRRQAELAQIMQAKGWYTAPRLHPEDIQAVMPQIQSLIQGSPQGIGGFGQQGLSQNVSGLSQQGFTQNVGGLGQQGFTQSLGGFGQQSFAQNAGAMSPQGFTQNLGGVGQQGFTQNAIGLGQQSPIATNAYQLQ